MRTLYNNHTQWYIIINVKATILNWKCKQIMTGVAINTDQSQ